MPLVNLTFDFWRAQVLKCGKPPRWLAWTGDSSVWRSSLNEIGNFTSMIVSELLKSNIVDTNVTQIIPSIGNNDLPNECLGPLNIQAVLSTLYSVWGQFLTSKESQQSFLQGGYYFIDLNGNLPITVVALNTMFWSKRNAALSNETCISGTDPGSMQFMWLEKVLQRGCGLQPSKNCSRSFYLTGHVPPSVYNGGKVYYPACQQWYNSIAQTFSDRIVGHIYGDTHYDKFEILQNGAAVIFMAPSVHPTHNPAIRFWKVVQQTGQLLDYSQYFTRLNSLNNGTDSQFHYEYGPLNPFYPPEEEFDFEMQQQQRNLQQQLPPGYGLQDMSLGSWTTLSQDIAQNPNGSLSLLYQKYVKVSYPFFASDRDLFRKYPKQVIDDTCGSW